MLLTDVAATKIKSLIEQESRDNLRLRVAVQPGGCSGLSYQLFFDERSLDGDLVVDFGGVEVVIDRMSAPYLDGASIQYADTIEKQGFTIDNPNAGSSCACGDSFSWAAAPRAIRRWPVTSWAAIDGRAAARRARPRRNSPQRRGVHLSCPGA